MEDQAELKRQIEEVKRNGVLKRIAEQQDNFIEEVSEIDSEAVMSSRRSLGARTGSQESKTHLRNSFVSAKSLTSSNGAENNLTLR